MIRTLLALFVLAAAAAPLDAHHSVLGFDNRRGITLDGIVVAVRWENPHTRITFDVNRRGDVERWVIESESPVVLERLGWTRGSMERGDRIRTEGAPKKDGTRMVRCGFVEVNGRRLPCFPGFPGGTP